LSYLEKFVDFYGLYLISRLKRENWCGLGSGPRALSSTRRKLHQNFIGAGRSKRERVLFAYLLL